MRAQALVLISDPQSKGDIPLDFWYASYRLDIGIDTLLCKYTISQREDSTGRLNPANQTVTTKASLKERRHRLLDPHNDLLFRRAATETHGRGTAAATHK